MINWTIGIGGTYPNWTTAFINLPSPLDDDYTLTQISNISDSTSIYPNLTSGPYKLILTSNKFNPDSEADSWVSTFSGSYWRCFIIYDVTHAPKIEIKNLWLKYNGYNYSQQAMIYISQGSLGSNNDVYIYIHDNVIDCSGTIRRGICCNYSSVTTFTNRLVKIWNNKIFNRPFHNNNSYAGIMYRHGGSTVSGSELLLIENNNVLGGAYCYTIDANNSIINVSNNFGKTDYDVNTFYFNGTADYSYNNSSTDLSADTASNYGDNINNIILLDEFESITPGDSTFLHPKESGQLVDGGKIPDIIENIYGIGGIERPSGGKVSIGAYQYEFYVPIIVDPSIKTDYTEAAIARLAEQFKKKIILNKFIEGLTKQCVELEFVAFDMRTKRSIDTAENAQLDELGGSLGVLRNAMSDDDYRARLKLQVRINISSGEPEILIETFKSLTAGDTIVYLESPPAGVYIFTTGALKPTNLMSLMKSIAGGGIRVELATSGGESIAQVFAFAPDTGTTDMGGRGFNDIDAESGILSEIIT